MSYIADEFGNINCLYCTNCTNCLNCIGCQNCTNCEDCINCKDCKTCFSCEECKYCEECEYCIRSSECFKCSFCEGAAFTKHSIGEKDYQFFDDDHIVFPSKGRCQYSDKIESFFLVNGLKPYKRIPKKTEYKKKSVSELLSQKSYTTDVEELQKLIISQGPQIAWNIGSQYKRYWITSGKFTANFTMEALSIFLVLNKLSISKYDIQEYTGSDTPIRDLKEFYREFVFSFKLNDLSRYL